MCFNISDLWARKGRMQRLWASNLRIKRPTVPSLSFYPLLSPPVSLLLRFSIIPDSLLRATIYVSAASAGRRERERELRKEAARNTQWKYQEGLLVCLRVSRANNTDGKTGPGVHYSGKKCLDDRLCCIFTREEVDLEAAAKQLSLCGRSRLTRQAIQELVLEHWRDTQIKAPVDNNSLDRWTDGWIDW